MAVIDLEAFARAPVAHEPFSYLVVSNVIAPEDANGVLGDFPAIDHPGLMPVEATHYGPRFGALIAELQSEPVARAFSQKFDIDLVGCPTMITVRGRCQEKDGRIHTDSESKLVTALFYFNDRWEARGGRLRLLRKPDDLDDMIAEAPPDSGTVVAFRRSDNSFHGHEPYVGIRRYVMINWMASGFAARRELFRHRMSAQAKRLFSAPGPRAAASSAGSHG